MAAIYDVYTNWILQINFRWYKLETTSYKKCVARDYLFSFLNHDLLASIIGANNILYRDLSFIKVNNGKHKLNNTLPMIQQFDMSM